MKAADHCAPSPLKWHGGKQPLARRIAALLPPCLHYCELFFGGGAVLLARDPEGVSECANDLDGRLMGFWSVLRDESLFPAFARLCEATPLSEECWREAGRVLDDPAAGDSARLAWAFFVRCRQSLAGRMDSFAPPVRSRTRRGMNDGVSAWLSAVDGLPAAHARLRRVLVLSRPALDAIRTQDGPGTLFYADPPYPASTRTAPDVYRHEMTLEDHEALLAALCACQGAAAVSGYACPLYDRMLVGWRRHEWSVPNHASSAKTKGRETEVLWVRDAEG